ncbi:MAG: ArnT family glycosyltransferase [Verrucomicrobiales bacterium]
MAAEQSSEGRRVELSAALVVRRALCVLLLLWLVVFYLFLDFRGLSSPNGMDQAQIAREIARGHGFETKTIRPLALYQVNASQRDQLDKKDAPIVGFQDTYHAPLNPLLNSMVLRLFKGHWKYQTDAPIYYLDRVLAVTSALLMLAAIGVSYLLAARIFDARIAAVTAILLLLCQLLWKFAQSGLSQNLMLFLFSFAVYFLYKAVESAAARRSPMLWIGLCGGFFGLLALTHWLAIWIFIGAFVFVALYFRPRGATAILLLAVFVVIVTPWGIRNWTITGTPVGSGIYDLYNGLAQDTAGTAMRNFDPEKNPLPADGLPTKLILNSLRQIDQLYMMLGSVAVAPLFFLSLLHPFRRPEIAAFRWALLAMWIPAVMGMSLFGLPGGYTDPNQLHIIFVPMMSAYGLAFLSVLWTRMGLPTQYPIVRNGHFIAIALLSAAPLVLHMPQKVIQGLGSKGYPNWPPYVPAGITRLANWTEENEVILSDVPWAVAWYADRASMWLPSNLEQFETLKLYAAEQGTPMAGVFLTPVTTDGRLLSDITRGEYAPWAQLILRGELFRYQIDVLDPTFPFRYAQPMPVSNQSFFYSDSQRWMRDPDFGKRRGK